MKRAMAGSASGDPPKRRCILTVEAASSSTDRPRVVHTLALNVALDGELTLIIRARMEPEPEEVPNSEAFALGRPAGPVPYTPLEPIAKLISANIVRIMCPSRS